MKFFVAPLHVIQLIDIAHVLHCGQCRHQVLKRKKKKVISLGIKNLPQVTFSVLWSHRRFYNIVSTLMRNIGEVTL